MSRPKNTQVTMEQFKGMFQLGFTSNYGTWRCCGPWGDVCTCGRAIFIKDEIRVDEEGFVWERSPLGPICDIGHILDPNIVKDKDGNYIYRIFGLDKEHWKKVRQYQRALIIENFCRTISKVCMEAG